MVATYATSTSLTRTQLQAFHQDGFLILRDLFQQDEIAELLDTFMTMHASGPIPGCFSLASEEEAAADPLKRYPRMMHPHRVNEVARRYLLDDRLDRVLTALFDEEPLAAQTMVYFKPPGGRGQAQHQDNFFLKVEPGTCIAAWIALDPADEENGGLSVVPGTHAMDLFCPEEADLDVSFTREFVPVPEGLEAIPTQLAPGDVLFFNGSLVHGSGPNRSADRFRRSFICHYIPRSAEKMSSWYRPILTMSGEEVTIDANTNGGPCGTGDVGVH